jgi:O-succinylbenzoic acid--CoA ligase
VIPWEASSTETLLNPRLPNDDRECVQQLIARAGDLTGHVWLTTSGSTGRLKPVTLSKQALLASAAAVNAHLQAQPEDVWLNPLPTFHVGGLAIHARAHLTRARVMAFTSWSPEAYTRAVQSSGATLSSLVPTQVVDLIRTRCTSPITLRAVVVGGGPLPADLYTAGLGLGWPLLPSYGATECGSQAATAPFESLDRSVPPALRVLPHLTLRAAADGHIEMRGASLFTGYGTSHGLDDPKRDGWWRTDDLGTVDGGVVQVIGRADDVVKVLGESVVVSALDQTLDATRLALGLDGDAAIYAVPNERLGAALHLAYANLDRAGAERLAAAFNERVAPYERVTELRSVERIERTALGKVRRNRPVSDHDRL